MKHFLLLLWFSVAATSLPAGEIARQHEQFRGRGGAGMARTPAEIEDRSHGITRIGLEHSLCLGNCQSYTVFISSDGSLDWHGHANVKRMGHRTGRVSKEMFNDIALFIRDSGFQQLADDYALPLTDQQSIYTLVDINGQTKAIRNYGKAGPCRLWAIEQLIEKMVVQATWD